MFILRLCRVDGGRSQQTEELARIITMVAKKKTAAKKPAAKKAVKKAPAKKKPAAKKKK